MANTERIFALSRDPNVVLETHGLRMIIKDMGNGVRSVSSVDLIPLEHCAAEAALEGRARIPYPYPTWLYDIAVAAVATIGIDAGELRPSVANAVARVIDDHTIEYIGWKIPD